MVIVGGIGIVRMPDFFTRLHPSGLIDTMGAALIVGGLMLQAGLTQTSIKLGLIVVFLLFTSPTATHAVAHAALARGLKPWTKTAQQDEDD
jgi:multicomponent Na+:H+ antiporter subunit G